MKPNHCSWTKIGTITTDRLPKVLRYFLLGFRELPHQPDDRPPGRKFMKDEEIKKDY